MRLHSRSGVPAASPDEWRSRPVTLPFYYCLQLSGVAPLFGPHLGSLRTISLSSVRTVLEGFVLVLGGSVLPVVLLRVEGVVAAVLLGSGGPGPVAEVPACLVPRMGVVELVPPVGRCLLVGSCLTSLPGTRGALGSLAYLGYRMGVEDRAVAQSLVSRKQVVVLVALVIFGEVF